MITVNEVLDFDKREANKDKLLADIDKALTSNTNNLTVRTLFYALLKDYSADYLRDRLETAIEDFEGIRND
jgi:hypothetical protein